MDQKIIEIAFELSSVLLEAINESDFTQLNQQFDMSKEVWEEIQSEVLAYYCENIAPSPKLSLTRHKFEVFEYNDDGWGIEAGLNDETGKWTELTLHAELFQTEQGDYRLCYRLIEVM